MYTFPLSIAAVATCLLLLRSLVSVLCTAWKPGLASIPRAHWSVPYSRSWLLWQKRCANEHTARHEAHKKLGSVIRIGPQELSIDCIDNGVQTVYGGNWDKLSWSMFDGMDHPPMVGIAGPKEHAYRKKTIARVYTKTYVDNFSDLKEILAKYNTEKLYPLLQTRSADRTAVDTVLLASAYNMDITSAYVYGQENATNWIQDTDEAETYIKVFSTTMGPGATLLGETPFLTATLSKLGIHLVAPNLDDIFEKYGEFGARMLERARKTLNDATSHNDAAQKQNEKQQQPSVFEHMRGKLAEANTPKDQVDEAAGNEMLDHLHAGHEAGGIFVTYVFWRLSRDVGVQERLRAQLRALRAAGQPPETSSPLLDDVLEETMRLHPSVWGPFTRVAPSRGGRLGDFHHIPPGTVVSASAYTLGRNADVFPNPDEWRPQRWADATPEARREMKRWVWMFGSGARECIGKHLAILSMKSMVAAVYEDFKTTIAEETDMTHVEAMMARPKGGKLMLRFERA